MRICEVVHGCIVGDVEHLVLRDRRSRPACSRMSIQDHPATSTIRGGKIDRSERLTQRNEEAARHFLFRIPKFELG